LDRLTEQDEADPYAERQACYALGRMGGAAAEALPSILPRLKSGHMEVRWYAASAIGRIAENTNLNDSQNVLDALLAALADQDNDRYVRHHVVRSLGYLGPAAKTAGPQLVAQLKSGDGVLQVEAALALWRIASSQNAIAVVEEVMASADSEAAVLAVESAKHFGASQNQLLSAVVAALGHKSVDVRRAAVAALSDWPDVQTAATAIAEAAGEEKLQPEAACDALAGLAERVRSGVLANPATSKENYIKAAAPWYRQVIPLLAEFIKSDQPQVQLRAARALAHVGLLAGDALLTALVSDREATRLAAVRGLEALELRLADTPETGETEPARHLKRKLVPNILEGLRSPHAEAQFAAVRFLAALSIEAQDGPAEALGPELRNFHRHEDKRLRSYAAKALNNLGD